MHHTELDVAPAHVPDLHDSAPMGFLTLSADGHILTVNHAAARLLAEHSDALIGKPFSAFLAPDSRGCDALGTGNDQEPANHQLCLIRADGTRFWAHLAVSVCRHGSSEPVRQVALLDITGYKHTEQALRESEESYRMLFEAASDALLLIATGSFRIIKANSRAAELYGYSKEELTGRLITDLSNEPQATLRVLRETRAHPDNLIQVSLRLHRKKDGTVFPVEITGRFKLMHGQLVLLLAVRDITKRKQAEAVMAARLRLLRAAQERSLAEVLQLTLDEIEQLTGSQIGFYHFVEESQAALNLQAWSTNTRERMCRAKSFDRHYPINHAGVWVDSYRERRPIIHNDYASLPHRKGLPAGHAPVIRELVVPVLRGDAIVALLGVGNKPEDYTEQDVEIVAVFADLAWDIAERKRAQESLQESEQRYRLLFAAVTDALFLIDMASLRIVDVNVRAAELYGYSKDELIAMDYLTLSIEHQQSRECIEEIRRAPDDLIHIPLRLHRKKDGTTFPVEITGRFLRLEGRETLFIAARDISKRIEAEAALQKSEETYRLLINNLNDGFLVTDKDGFLILANEALARIYGYAAADDLLGTRILDHIIPERREAIGAIFTAAVAGAPFPELLEIPMLRKNGEVIHTEIKPTVRVHEDGTITTQGLLIDVTERKRMEEALRQSELERLRIQEETNAQLTEQAESLASIYRALDSVGVIVSDLEEEDARIRIFNTGAERLFGWRQDEAIGQSITLIYPTELYPLKVQRTRKLRQGESMQSFDMTLVRRSGERFPAVISVHPFDCHDGRCRKAVGVFRDISELKRVQMELEAINEDLERRVEARTKELQETQKQYLHAEKLSAIGKLSASIAHEFNNPLQGILSIIKGVKKRAILAHEDGELLDAAIGECDRIKELIRSLQDFNRPSSGRKTMMDVHKSLDSILLLHKSDFKNKRIRVERDYAGHLPQILVVPDQIKQVFLNVLTNAADACHSPGCIITVSTRFADESVVVAISDTGIGIRPEEMELIFQPFYTTKPEVKGTGLGLSVSYGIIKKHGGTIEVASQPGVGTTFTIRLPLRAPDDPGEYTSITPMRMPDPAS